MKRGETGAGSSKGRTPEVDAIASERITVKERFDICS